MTSTKRTQLQLLLDLADSTFGGDHPPSPQQVHALRQALALVPLRELGIELQQNGFPDLSTHVHTTRSTSEIIYLHIFEDPRFSLGIFCLLKDAEIPLHNHPDMTVFSRVLYGTMHVQSYDLKDPASIDKGVITVHDKNFTADDAPMLLFPTNGGNIHQFKAVTACAVLDLLSPPYSTEDGRDCTYYRVRPTNSSTTYSTITHDDVFLEECDPPEDFVVISEQFQGLAVDTIPRAQNRRVSDDGDDTTTPSWSSGGSAGSPRSVTPPGGEMAPGVCADGDGNNPLSVDQAAKASALATRLENSHLSPNSESMNTLEGR